MTLRRVVRNRAGVNLIYAYHTHRGGAKRRGIKFILTYEEWLSIWRKSGHLPQRGIKRGQYVMARKRDTGSYAKGNVSIITVTKNLNGKTGMKYNRKPFLVPGTSQHPG